MQPADTRDLIATARATLKAEVLPYLPPDRLYPARMVLNALGIALRQLDEGGARRAAALDALAPFAPGGDLDSVAAALAEALRAGAPADPAALHAALLAVARDATEESNPAARALSAPPGSTATPAGPGRS
jgi:hypothetical protein